MFWDTNLQKQKRWMEEMGQRKRKRKEKDLEHDGALVILVYYAMTPNIILQPHFELELFVNKTCENSTSVNTRAAQTHEKQNYNIHHTREWETLRKIIHYMCCCIIDICTTHKQRETCIRVWILSDAPWNICFCWCCSVPLALSFAIYIWIFIYVFLSLYWRALGTPFAFGQFNDSVWTLLYDIFNASTLWIQKVQMNFKYSYRVYIHELERIRNACDGLQYSCGTKNVLCVVAGK